MGSLVSFNTSIRNGVPRGSDIEYVDLRPELSKSGILYGVRNYSMCVS
jgi:hypothetical protein